MLRWIVWFAIGFFLFAVGALAVSDPQHRLQGLTMLAGFGLWLWLVVTFLAVPIAIVMWLLRLRRADRE
jgi:hypothetical protein